MLKDLIENKQKIHTRQITLATYPHTDNRVLIHAELIDKRAVPIFDITGTVKTPGIIHHISLYLLIEPEPLRITDAQAKMHTVPLEECVSCLDTVEELKGLEVKSGFSGRVRRLMGGTRGCTHLCNLVLSSAQEIVHGWLTEKRSRKAPLPASIDDLKEKNYLVDSCRIWKKDGPRMKQFSRE